MVTKRTPKLKTVDVIFSLPGEVDAESIALCGEFNEWSTETLALERNGDNCWQTSVALEPGSYRYRYLIDGHRWENGWQADSYIPNDFGCDDSVVVVE